jgi:hypothetical protein
MEMAMIRIARTRRAVRGQTYELVFGYTSGLDLIGHVSHSRPALQHGAYDELNEFVGELRADLHEEDELVIVSDHGLQNGLHTDEAMVAGPADVVEDVESVLDIREAIEGMLTDGVHSPSGRWEDTTDSGQSAEVRQQLKDLGYM